MKILKTNNSQVDVLKNKTDSPHLPLAEKKEIKEFDFYLNNFFDDFSDEEFKNWDEFPILLPRHERFWDNGYPMSQGTLQSGSMR